jgi:hypothetical protein
MKISEKQIKQLINIALEYYAYLSLIEARPCRQKEILTCIELIQNQQSEELKEIK